jgi:regulator of sigma E protease
MVFLQALLAFAVVIGILVTIHEFGHFWVAKKLGVKILRFSIGFGNPFWSRRFGKDKTEFAIAPIPLGGYVKMLDEREGEVAPEELHRAFNQQSLKVRTAIVFAGPLFNFLFAILAYTMMYMYGVTGMAALVGEVTPQSVAEQAGFNVGDQIIAVNGQPTLRWSSVIEASLQQMLDDKQELIYSVKNRQGYESNLRLNLGNLTVDDIAGGEFFQKFGMRPFRPPLPALIGEVTANSAAEQAGLKRGDKIIKLDNQEISDWTALVKYIIQRPEQDIRVEIERNHQQLSLILRPDNVSGKGRMGVYAPYFVTERYGVWKAFTQGIEKTWDMSVLTLRLMAKMLTLQISYEHISGPISIAQFAGQSAQLGIAIFLSFLGLVSVSLGVLNLLPIPLLDGGHLFLYLIEGIKGSPVSENTESVLQRVGLTLLIGLMGLAVFNDLGRLFS